MPIVYVPTSEPFLYSPDSPTKLIFGAPKVSPLITPLYFMVAVGTSLPKSISIWERVIAAVASLFETVKLVVSPEEM